MYTKEDIEKAKQYLDNEGYGTGSNFTLNAVANLMAEYAAKNCVIPAVSSSALSKVEQYNKLKKEMKEEILRLKPIIDDLSTLFNIGTVEERKELLGKISKLEWAVHQMKHCC